MFLINNIKRLLILSLYIFTVISSSQHLITVIQKATNNTLFDNVLLTILSTIALVMVWYNFKVDRSDVVVLISTFVVTCFFSIMYVGFDIKIMIFNMMLAIMFSKYINVENKNDHQFIWLNAWTYFAMTIFFIYVFTGIFDFWFSMLFSMIMLNTLLKQSKAIDKQDSNIKLEVRKEVVLYLITINLLFIIQ